MKVLLITCLLLLGTQKAAFCQSKCAVVYDQFDIMPVLPDLQNAMYKHASTQITPIIGMMAGKDPECMLSSLHAKLLVNTQGKVIDVYFRTYMPFVLQERLCEEFLKMEGFQPAVYNGQTVCAMFPYVIRCMSWQE
ncbi:hypothetical protein Cpin_1122 [Chitinophaga pinensis DSM 2588]|uniref:Uncharacterized protein n=2 Tax=Chitinophaga pinensis TaxID=79329 RepID=A0A979G0I7_CHIPD|nr:hypothetical protein Cpin_1122 [Chitinophaga pinensis DSM 2588]